MVGQRVGYYKIRYLRGKIDGTALQQNKLHPDVESHRFPCFERMTCSRILGRSVRIPLHRNSTIYFLLTVK